MSGMQGPHTWEHQRQGLVCVCVWGAYLTWCLHSLLRTKILSTLPSEASFPSQKIELHSFLWSYPKLLSFFLDPDLTAHFEADVDWVETKCACCWRTGIFLGCRFLRSVISLHYKAEQWCLVVSRTHTFSSLHFRVDNRACETLTLPNSLS